MPTTILQTKLFIPPANPAHISRQRLLDRLNSGLRAKLTLVAAPPGFGKTSIISAWVKHAEIPVGWLSLDQRDNDPTQFFSHFIAALQACQPSLGAQTLVELFTSQSFSIEALLIDLINEIARLPGRYLLVVDDFHLIENQAVHLGIVFLLEHLPSQLHLVIATRSDPPLPLAKLRARGAINELRVEDLRFDMEEANTFLKAAIGNAITPSEIAALETRTEGWITGLQLAVLSMKSHNEQSSFIQSFTGSNRYIIDYLVEEVLNQLPAYMRQFLLQTSVLDRFCGDLCDATLMPGGQESLSAETKVESAPRLPPGKSQEILEQLERSNIFLIPLDSQRHWYRYHHLFADILRHLLSIQESSLVPILHHRASFWFASTGLLEEAIEHAFAARDWQLASHHISQNSRQLFLRGEFYRLIGWVQRVPADHVRGDIKLSLYYAWSLLLAGKIDEAETVWRSMEPQLTGSKQTFVSVGEMVLGALVAYHSSRPREALPIMNKAIQQLHGKTSSPDEQLLYGFAYVGLADSYRILGQIDLAEKAYREALPINQKVENLLGMLVCYRNLGDILFERAQLQKAIDMYQEGIERSRAWAEKEFGRVYDLLPSANFFMRIGEVHFERDDLEEAAAMMNKAIQLLELSGSTHLTNAYYQQAQILLARNDLFAVHEFLQKLRRFAAGISASYTHAQSEVFLADLRIRLAGRPLPPDYPVGIAALKNEIDDWVHSVEGFDFGPFPYRYDTQSGTLARAFLFQGRPEKAVALLTPLLEAARSRGRQRSVIRRLIILARAYQALGDQTSALNAISEALGMSESHGLLRTILDEGPEVQPLLQSALHHNITPRFTARLLDMRSGSEPDSEPQARANRLLIEPLSERELEVLSLVAGGLSNQQIAEKLFVALSTVKKHTSSILGKLNVESRTEAIQRARTLGLI